MMKKKGFWRQNEGQRMCASFSFHPLCCCMHTRKTTIYEYERYGSCVYCCVCIAKKETKPQKMMKYASRIRLGYSNSTIICIKMGNLLFPLAQKTHFKLPAIPHNVDSIPIHLVLWTPTMIYSRKNIFHYYS